MTASNGRGRSVRLTTLVLAGALLSAESHAAAQRAGAPRLTARHTIVDEHINPSAGLIRVMDRNGREVKTLPGWTLEILAHDVLLYHRSQVHFAPTHSVELWTWNPNTRRDARLYPRGTPDSVRQTYIDTVRAIYTRVGPDWFKQNNHHMDPTRFDSRLRDSVVASIDGDRLAFLVEFGGGEGTPAATPPLTVVVTCQRVQVNAGRCRERPLAEIEKAFPGLTARQLLDRVLPGPR